MEHNFTQLLEKKNKISFCTILFAVHRLYVALFKCWGGDKAKKNPNRCSKNLKKKFALGPEPSP